MGKDAFYFPHDSNSIQDPKMMTLLSECGLSGIGMFWIIIEILHQQESGSITENEFKKYINFYCHFQTQGQHLLDKIEQVLISSKLLTLKNGFVCSERVVKNKKHREEISEKRSIAGKKSAESRLNPTNAQHLLNKCQHTKGKERKGKESKYINTAIVPDFFNYYILKTKKAFKLTSSNRALIIKRLKDGFTLEQLKLAVDNFIQDEWPERYKNLDLIYCIGKQNGKPDNLEKWLNYKPNFKPIGFKKP